MAETEPAAAVAAGCDAAMSALWNLSLRSPKCEVKRALASQCCCCDTVSQRVAPPFTAALPPL